MVARSVNRNNIAYNFTGNPLYMRDKESPVKLAVSLFFFVNFLYVRPVSARARGLKRNPCRP
jgi:hypothetical protein